MFTHIRYLIFQLPSASFFVRRLHKKWNRLFILGLSSLFLSLGLTDHCISQNMETMKFPDGSSIEIDTTPCGKIDLKENMEFLEKHIIAYYHYDKEDVRSINIRLTCDYKEKHMPKGNYPLMSINTYEKILEIMNRRKPFGDKVIDNPVSFISGHVFRKSSEYKNAWIKWSEFSCRDEGKNEKFGCGIKSIDIIYKSTSPAP
jgi:hypothetical protein